MSHISKIEIQINDLTALKQACKRLGLDFQENKQSFTWYKGQGQCDHCIRVPGAKYEVGLKTEDKCYTLLWDDWRSGGLVDRLGNDAGKLKQAYAVQRVKREATQRHYKIREKQTEQGIRLEVYPR